MKAGRIVWSMPLTMCAVILCAIMAGSHPVIAGEPPTAKIMVNPVPAKVGPPYPPLIGGGPNIVGNELRLDAGGVRVWVEVHLQDWDPNGDGSPAVYAFVAAVDGIGLRDADINGDGSVADDGDQEDITLAAVSCTSDAICRTAFGQATPDVDCDHGTCLPVYTDKGGFRVDGWCAGEGCSGGERAVISPSGWLAFATYNAAFRPDDGTVRWGATAVYDVPPGAKGKYTVQLNTDETYFLTWLGGPLPQEVPTLSETGFVINVLTGRCCFGFGTPAEGCVDAVSRAECGDDEPGPFVFTPEAACPHDGPDCEPIMVACCHGDPFGSCADDTPVDECQCPDCSWDQFHRCTEIECAPIPIPTASGWGLAVLTLLLMIGAKIAFGRRLETRMT